MIHWKHTGFKLCCVVSVLRCCLHRHILYSDPLNSSCVGVYLPLLNRQMFALTAWRDSNISSVLIPLFFFFLSRSEGGTCRFKTTRSPAPWAATTRWPTSGASGSRSTSPGTGSGWPWWTAASTPSAARRAPRITTRWRSETLIHSTRHSRSNLILME